MLMDVELSVGHHLRLFSTRAKGYVEHYYLELEFFELWMTLIKILGRLYISNLRMVEEEQCRR